MDNASINENSKGRGGKGKGWVVSDLFYGFDLKIDQKQNTKK